MENKINFNIPNITIKNTVSISEKEGIFLGVIIAFIHDRDINEEIILSFTTLRECLHSTDDETLKILKSMSQKVLEISMNESNDEYLINIFSNISYNLNKKEVKLRLNNTIPMLSKRIVEMYKYMAGFKESNLKGKYSWKVYEILRTLDANKTYYASIDYLKNILGIKDTYKLYADFKRKVLVYTQNEINEKTDIMFEFEEVKEEKRIVGIDITVSRKKV